MARLARTWADSGTDTPRWTYVKDSSGSGGDDCGRLDYVRWVPAGSMPQPDFLAQGVDAEYLSFTTGSLAGRAQIKMQIAK